MISSEDILTSQTNGIVVSACPVLMEEACSRQEMFRWGYYLCIENNSNHKIQLVGKDWNITDDRGNRYSDTTAGFKGELPELEPGEYFEFTSEASLKSANAVFYGSCKILAEGRAQTIKIPTFNLSAKSNSLRTLN